jgi:hypothetical protein
MSSQIGKVVRTTLLNDAAIASTVSNRVYPLVMPMNTDFPAIMYTVLNTKSDSHLKGTTGIAESMLQLDGYGQNYSSLLSLMELVRLEIQSIRGTYDSVFISSIDLDSSYDMFDRPEDGSDLGLYRVVQTYNCFYQETSVSR